MTGSNRERAEAVEASIARAYGPEGTVDEHIIDCLVDLMHLCDLYGFDYGAMTATAREHYNDEVLAESR